MLTKFITWLHSKLGHIYVWGAQGENLTVMKDPDGWIAKREKYDAIQVARVLWLFDTRKLEGLNPIYAFDCSGLIVCWLLQEKLIKNDMSADGLYKTYGKGALIPAQLKPGDPVFIYSNNSKKMTHVGVYVGNGETIEAYGRDKGVVKRLLMQGEWTHMGRFPFFEAAPEPKKWVVKRVLKLTSPPMQGDDVVELKQRLLKLGYLKAATKPTFGSDTDKAVRAFQKDKKLTVDGKAGRDTITALGGVWQE